VSTKGSPPLPGAGPATATVLDDATTLSGTEPVDTSSTAVPASRTVKVPATGAASYHRPALTHLLIHLLISPAADSHLTRSGAVQPREHRLDLTQWQI
jgi:hypothetical protein